MNSYEKFVRYCIGIGKTPSRVALEAGISKPVISSWKSGRTKPTDATMAKITSYLDVPMDAFREDIGEEESPPAISGKRALDQTLIERLACLTPAEEAKVDAFVQGLLASRPGGVSHPG